MIARFTEVQHDGVFEDDSGEYVWYSDYEKLQSELKAKDDLISKMLSLLLSVSLCIKGEDCQSIFELEKKIDKCIDNVNEGTQQIKESE